MRTLKEKDDGNKIKGGFFTNTTRKRINFGNSKKWREREREREKQSTSA